MVKIGRGQQNYPRCRCRHRLQSFLTMKKTVLSDQQWMPWEIQKKISLLAVAILFLFTFFNLILDAPRIILVELWRQAFHGWIVYAYTLTSVKYQPVCAGVNVFGLSVTQLKSTAN